MAAADMIRQRLEGRAAWDPARTARISSFALCVHAPFLHFFHRRLDLVFGTQRTVATTFKKIFVDQAIITPPFFVVFLSYDTLLAGGGLASTRRKLETR